MQVSLLKPLVARPQAITRLAANRNHNRLLHHALVRSQAADKPAEPEQQPQSGVAKAPESGGLAVAPFFKDWGFPGFGRMNRMMREMEQEMNSLSRAFGMPALRTWEVDLPSAVPAAAHVLACDVQDEGDHLLVEADVPGLSKEDIKVVMSPDKVLTISGERRQEKEEGKQGEGVWRVERTYGSFMRRFRLPDNVSAEGIKAQVKDGVLRLNIPKTETLAPKEIEVNLSEE